MTSLTKFPLVFLLLIVQPLVAQQDTTTFPWPVTPFDSPHEITGVYGEYRGPSNPHFHNGTDIPKADGSPVYPVFDGIVQSLTPTGSSAFVRVAYFNGGTDAYVHIQPNPLLTVGSAVTARTTVLGTILSGLANVHFTNGPVAPEGTKNAIRPDGGLTPFVDIFPPTIASVTFYKDGTTLRFPDNRVSGLVDIWVHIREATAPNSSLLRESTRNNGTYKIGYKILTADTDSVVYEPPVNGLRYQFDRKPSNTFANTVYAPGSDNGTHIYVVTNGNGAGNLTIPNNYWDSRTVPPGPYVVMIFAEDTRSNTDTAFVGVEVTDQDLFPPSPTTLRAVLTDSAGAFTVSWYPNVEQDLRGYRLYFSLDGKSWNLREDESELPASRTSISFSGILGSPPIYFRLTAVDSADPVNESLPSDVYGISLNSSSTRYLIVDGFDRTQESGSYHEPSHPFAMTHGMSLPVDFNTCANEAVSEGTVQLSDYSEVVWFLGDESTFDETFDSIGQLKVKEYLEQGGKLFVSGSEVAWDLDRPSGPSASDREFFHTYLKAVYAGDDSESFTVSGIDGTIFDGLSFGYGETGLGSPYEEDWPDYLEPTGGSEVVMGYGNSLKAAVAYSGRFGNGIDSGALVYLGFPFETIHLKSARDSIMNRVVRYFDQLTSVGIVPTTAGLPEEFRLDQNYPNPFNPTTTIVYELPVGGKVRLEVYTVLGEKVLTLVEEQQEAGRYEVRLNAQQIASGVYFYRLILSEEKGTPLFLDTKKMIVIK